MGGKESYSDRLRREGGMVAFGKFKGERREATCECCRRNDAPAGERFCVSCVLHRSEELASANADRHRLEILYEEARREQHRWEDIAAERGTRMDEIQARAEAAEAEVRRLTQGLRDIRDPTVLAPFRRFTQEELERELDRIQDKARALLATSPPDDPTGKGAP